MELPIEQFYMGFQALDAEQMLKYYSDEVIFEDPAFGILRGKKAHNMWKMLCKSQQGKDFKLDFSKVSYSGTKGSAHWEAWYDFSKTGRRVHNIIEAEFEFSDGMIIRHIDRFNLYRWSRQALGITGALIGWTGFFRKGLQRQTNAMLVKFESEYLP